MTRIQKKVLTQTFLLGIIVTFVVVIVDSLGGLESFEHFLYDRRARYFQFFTPPATDQVVHANIDDETLQLIGPWPWDRDLFAEVIDEVRQAGAKVVAMDIIFLEPQNQIWRPRSHAGADQSQADDSSHAPEASQAGSATATTLPAADFVPVDRDAVLAREFAAVAKPVLGVLTPPAPIPTREYKTIYAALYENLELSQDELVGKVGMMGQDVTRYLTARKFAMREHLFTLMRDEPNITPAQAAARLLPHTSFDVSSPLMRTLTEQFSHCVSVRNMFFHLPPVPKGRHAPFLPTDLEFPPIAPFTAAASHNGSIIYIGDSDGAVRSVPLWIEYRGRLFPQLGLASALAMLDVDLHTIKFRPDGFTIIKRDNTECFVPTHELLSDKAPLENGKRPGYFFDVPWFGKANSFLTMYDPRHADTAQQISVTTIWKYHQLKERIRRNNRNADQAYRRFYDFVETSAIAEYDEAMKAFGPDDWAPRKPFIKRALEVAKDAGYLRPPKTVTTRDEQVEEDMVAAVNALNTIYLNSDELIREAKKQHAELEQVKGKAVLIGWTATAVIADFVPTSLHDRAPGMTIHGTIFNAVMTEHFWRRTPEWFVSCVAILVGVVATAFIATLSAVPAFIACLALVVFYLAVNGLIVFDYSGYILGIAGPIVTIAVVWSTGTVFRFVVESRELKRITESFQTRVDPALVKYVIDNPDKVQLTGEERELSVVFTDLAGFTTLSEKLGKDTVTMLNKYMGIMVPAIRRHRGYVNKFLGDGIMFFFGAPFESPQHARQAVTTVIEMQKLLIEFNKELTASNLPTLKMRAGISTGQMIVGDAGSTDAEHRAADYTVLGDLVNLGARLESANKATGTLMLMTERTIELMGDSILCRPIGRLVVVGKTQGVMVYEPLAMRNEATPAQLKLVDLTTEVVMAFQAGDFAACIAHTKTLEEEAGAGKLTNLYRELSEEYLQTPPPEPFDGCITLSEK
jgi:class 3 adenylate cyclase/CHASE2 domain-containing sensor protein